ncbi:MAG: transketolase family protein [Flintibacter sp.]|uniref:transketolase family protein n=1 Tax=Flintibacter sp. TaxID=1918624 RepID=UPI002671E1D9|nr:transketolase family protein [Flintibacter sp.]MCI6149453.1 transketolase family protein [Flintibacter sp.]MDY5038275.1 transketolase family protein [Lawsonibacter sp.]
MNKIPMRDGYGKALLKLIGDGKPVVALDADVAKSTRTVWVRDQYPEHFLDMGIAEQDMVGTASGLALGGIIPFASTYGVFLAGRAWDQIRTTVCYNNLNVKLAGAHAGISVGPDGATHQALEDVALMRVLPNMTVVVPCDAVETEKATLALAEREGPCYIRFGREAVPVITDEDSPFEIGKANVLRDGKDAVLFANGAMVYEGLEAAKQLAGEGIDLMVINLHTVKPLDQEAVLAAARKTGRVITAEEHQAAGGMGSAVAECLAQHYPVPMRILGMQDGFGESGAPDELMKRYGFSSDAIYQAVKDFVAL